MPDLPQDSPSREDLLNVVIASYLEAIGRGEAVDPLAYVDQHPDFAAELALFFDDRAEFQRAAGDLSPKVRRTHDPATLTDTPPPDPSQTTWIYEEPILDGTGSPTNRFGDYELLEEIARGGMGVVYKARQIKLNRVVALKMILAGQLASAEDVKRFRIEAEAAAQLDHPGIVPIFEVGEHHGQHYFSMGYVDGPSLAKRVAEGPLLPREAAEMLKTVAEAVEYAHQHGVIHRDLKPGNILLAQGRVVSGPVVSRKEPGTTHHSAVTTHQPKVTDFGLAKRVEGDSSVTDTGQILGTPSYMPPEQAAGKAAAVGPASDVYSLGAVLYCLLTGRPPFQGPSPLDTLWQVLEQEPAPPRLLNATLARDLETICLKCLRKEPEKRYAGAGELATDLGRFLAGEPIRARRTGVGERVVKWVKRRPAVAGLAATVVIILVVGSLVAAEMRNAAIAAGLIDSLQHADADGVKPVLQQLDSYRRWATPSLVALAGADPKSVDERRAKLHARMALVARDELQVSPLVEELLTGHVSNVGVIRDQLAPYQHQFQSDLWELLHDGTKAPTRRFRAGLALAGYAAESEQWTPEDDAFLAGQLLAANPEHQQRLREYLRPLDNRLLVDLERIFVDAKATESQQLGTANALADFAAKDILRLASLLSAATPGQYEILYPLVADARDAAVRESLKQLVREVPGAELPASERVALGQRRAGAAITLLRQGERESILDVLRADSGGGLRSDSGSGLRGDDPESLTQFVHRCRQRGILPAQLLECLTLADQLRQSKTGEARRTEDRVLYALLLALGDFDLTELPTAQRRDLVGQLADWYATDPSSAIHGATSWLLRHWKQDGLAKKVDRTPVPYASDREWYTLRFVVPPGETKSPEGGTTNEFGPGDRGMTFYITFVVFQSGEYLMGSASDEADRQSNERLHRVKLTRPLAVSDREITWEQFASFDGGDKHDAWEKQFSRQLTLEEPVFGLSWFEAVNYCRWLTDLAQMPESGQCYEAPETLPKDSEGNPTQWPVDFDRRGFRLPTEAEWEMVCRGGTKTAFSFGNDARLLGRYDWFQENSEKWSHPVGQLRPNPRGLFDVHGNLSEWCHDWTGDYAAESESEDPMGPPKASTRISRGGNWFYHAGYGRSATRTSTVPTVLSFSLGFRVAVIPFNQDDALVAQGQAPEAMITAPFDADQAIAIQEASAEHLGSNVEISNSIGMKLRVIPPCRFKMGSPQVEHDQAWQRFYSSECPRHGVQLTRAFCLGNCEVTQQQFQEVMGVNPSWFSLTGEGKDAVQGMDTRWHPVDNVSWFDAVDFCNKLSEREQRSPYYVREGETVKVLGGTGYRLPTEAEWEFACRAGSTTLWAFGNNEPDLPHHAWLDSNAGNRTHRVGDLLPNPFGLHDLYGNVWEWCWDWYDYYSAMAVKDPTGAPAGAFTAGNTRVMRGGGFSSGPLYARSANRYGYSPRGKGNNLGFRVARTLP